jgi:hypothetical protein
MHAYFRQLYRFVKVITLTTLLIMLFNLGAIVVDAVFPELHTWTSRAHASIIWSMLMLVLVQNLVMTRIIRVIEASLGAPAKTDEVIIGNGKSESEA